MTATRPPPASAPTASPPAISDAEADVMQVLWHQAPRDAEAVHAALAAHRHWQLATVKTLLNRLLRKGAVRAERVERRFLYTPVLGRDAWQRAQGIGLLDRLFGGRLSPLVSHFARERRLHPDDVAALRALLDAQEADDAVVAPAPRATSTRGRRRG